MSSFCVSPRTAPSCMHPPAHDLCCMLGGPGQLLPCMHPSVHRTDHVTAAAGQLLRPPITLQQTPTDLLFCRHTGFAACWTGLVSYFWACTALPALLLLAGPEGDEGSWAAGAQWLAKRAHAAHPELFRATWRAATWARAKVAAADAAWQRALASRPPARARGGSRVTAGAGTQRGASAAEVQVGDMDFHFVGLPAGATPDMMLNISCALSPLLVQHAGRWCDAATQHSHRSPLPA